MGQRALIIGVKTSNHTENDNMGRSFSTSSDSRFNGQKKSLIFIEPTCSLPSSHQSAIGPILIHINAGRSFILSTNRMELSKKIYDVTTLFNLMLAWSNSSYGGTVCTYVSPYQITRLHVIRQRPFHLPPWELKCHIFITTKTKATQM